LLNPYDFSKINRHDSLFKENIITRKLSGMNIILTTIGRKSGQARSHEVSAVKDGNDFITAASNGGAPKNSLWYVNLAAEPRTKVRANGRTVDTIATVVTDEEEYQRLWVKLTQEYPVYDYFQRRTSRKFPIVRLSPTHS